MKKNKYVIIEQTDDCDNTFVTFIKAETPEEALDDYCNVSMGSIIILTETAYYNLCLNGIKK